MRKIRVILITVIVLAFAVPKQAAAQPGRLDTVKINLPIKAIELAYYGSYLAGSTDSSDMRFNDTVKAKIKISPPANWNAIVNLVRVPGKFIVFIYELGNRIPGGELIKLGIDVLNTIKAINHPVIQYHVGRVDAQHEQGVNTHVRTGKNLYID